MTGIDKTYQLSDSVSFPKAAKRQKLLRYYQGFGGELKFGTRYRHFYQKDSFLIGMSSFIEIIDVKLLFNAQNGD